MDRYLCDLLIRHGAPLLFVAQLFGIVGLPVPDEVLLTAAGALIKRGDLQSGATIIAAIAGCVTGMTLSYVLGRTVGPRALRRFSVLQGESIDRGQAWFERSGKWLLAFGCFVPGARHLTPIAAGAVALDFRLFAAYAYPGAVLWSVTFVSAGYYGSNEWIRAAVLLRAHLIIASIVLAALAIGYVFVSRREHR
jgi:membrane protein DedA with SNARE-associated domain